MGLRCRKFSTTDKMRDDENSIVAQAEQNSWCQTPQLPYLPTWSFELGVIGHSHRLTYTGLLEEANPN